MSANANPVIGIPTTSLNATATLKFRDMSTAATTARQGGNPPRDAATGSVAKLREMEKDLA